MKYDIQEILKFNELESIQDSFNLAKLVSSMIDTENARNIIIHILDIWDRVNEQSKPIWVDLIERAGFYPYLKEHDDESLGIQAKIRKQWYKSQYLEGVYFHAKQKIIEQKIIEGRNVAVSAPTSFGKSLIIEEIVAQNKFDNILIIQPTLALIDETRKKMSKYADYNIIVNTLQETHERNILILTAERVLEYENLPVIDFFIVDEFYKVSTRRSDERIDVLNIAIHKMLAFQPQALFLTPSINALSNDFIIKYEIDFLKTDYSLVNTNVQEIRFKNSAEKKSKLFEMLSKNPDPSLVYMSSPHKAYTLANEYMYYLSEKNMLNKKAIELPLVEWIDKNISEKWNLKYLLDSGIGVHNGELPRHVVTSQLEYFEDKKLNVLFVTTSLIEGVNTSAKTMYIFETTKANTTIDFFDYSNIKGRAGRMNKYFTGEVFIFGRIPDEEDFQIDVPFVEQKNISNEILINLDEDEVKEEHNDRLNDLKKDIPEELMNIIKKNIINITGQKELYRYLEDNYKILNSTLTWGSIPNYDQLSGTLLLAYKFLENENTHERYTNMLAARSLSIINSPSLKTVINKQYDYQYNVDIKNVLKKGQELNQDTLNVIDKRATEKAIKDILCFVRKDAGYTIPKLLNVLQSIQEYVYIQYNLPYGDYAYFSARLENEQVDERLRMLIDFGVPTSAIRSISKLIPLNLESDKEIIRYVKSNFQVVSQNLIEYEKRLLLLAIQV
ncbi:DEAD/DEAH box helicase [Enterococcus plantarum]|uniref:DEAD/DEAH box helicase n=1 Tax=Enterococcus plantarum TaxID=1077675 RepID=UPI001A8DC8B9|nr:DEAD/DEAH box helicase [Enterococcus plantarum]MBO0468002.1 DEAD/DEAH box helicase [Enterococcus plantarum]